MKLSDSLTELFVSSRVRLAAAAAMMSCRGHSQALLHVWTSVQDQRPMA